MSAANFLTATPGKWATLLGVLQHRVRWAEACHKHFIKKQRDQKVMIHGHLKSS